MDVFEFEKSLLTRMEETLAVLSARGECIPASAVRTEWANYVEVAIEPTGWQALWRIPRVLCEDLSVSYPTIIMGTVQQVLFDEMKAIFHVQAVQEDDVHLMERQLVSLEELWPLREQENEALNVDRTADCIDRLRFFYQHIWMPWDNDSDDDRVDWASKHLESRVKFYYDLKNKTMSKRLSSHLLALLAEGNYIQKKREILEMEIDLQDEDSGVDETNLSQHSKASDLMKLHLRLNSIKNEVDILENPAMREVYEKALFPTEDSCFKNTSTGGPLSVETLVVTHIGTLEQQIQYLNEAKKDIESHKFVRMCDSLQGALDRCKASDELYLPPGKHLIKFLEYLNGGGSLKAISAINFVEASEQRRLDVIDEVAVVCSKDDDSVLLTIDGDYCFENILLDCTNVRSGVLIKRGNVAFQNCCFIGDPKSTTKQGIVIFGNSTVRFKGCVIKDFSTGIYSNRNSTIELSESLIDSCITGIEMMHAGSINFSSSKIINCKSYGVILDVDDLNGSLKGESRLTFEDYNQIDRKEFNFRGACEFKDNGRANFAVFNGNDSEFNSSCFVDVPDSAEELEDCQSNKRKNIDEH